MTAVNEAICATFPLAMSGPGASSEESKAPVQLGGNCVQTNGAKTKPTGNGCVNGVTGSHVITNELPPNSLTEKEKALQSLTNFDFPSAPLEPVTEPFNYVCSLKSKQVRDKLILSLSPWIPLPTASLRLVISLVAGIHNTSLMLDDVQDNSALRRSSPAAHTIFGMPQTVNSAVYQTVDIIQKSLESGNRLIMEEVIVGMKALLVGQGLDIVWTSNGTTPSLDEYLQMIDGKTGALFVMIYRLMMAASPDPGANIPLTRLMLLLGRHFQIRDDYVNIVSPKYTESKGYCSDLDEGKCSFMILHAIQNASPASRSLLRNMLLQVRKAGSAGERHKELMVSIMEEAGSLKYTAEMLLEIEKTILVEVETIEKVTGIINPVLKDLLGALRA